MFTSHVRFLPVFASLDRVLMHSAQDRLRPVWTGFFRFFPVPVLSPQNLGLLGTSPGSGSSKKGEKTGTGPDFKVLATIENHSN